MSLVLETLESKFGTFGYFNEEGSFIIPALTKEIYWDKCQVSDKDVIFERGTFSGIWARAIKEKKILSSNEGPFSYPEGHVPIENTMVTPIIFENRVISAIQVANKQPSYDDKDRELMKTIAHFVAPVLSARIENNRREAERKKTEELLQREGRKAQEYLDIAGVILVVINAEKKVILINKKGCEILGYKEEEIIGKNWFDNFLPKKTRDETMKISNNIFDGIIEPTKFFENPVLTKDGRERIIAWHNTPLYDEEGKLVSHLSSGEDITERKQSDDAIREAEMRYRTVADFTYEWEYWQNPDGTLRYTSPSCERISGYTSEQFMTNPHLLEEIILPEDREKWEQHPHGNVEKSGQEVQFRIRRRDGKTAWIMHVCQSVINTRGEFLGFRATHRDITEQRIAEDELRSSEERLKILFEFAPDAYYLNDLKGNFIDGNRIAEELTGYQRKELIGKNFLKLKLLSLKQAPRAAALLTKNALGKSTGPDEFTLTRKDGTQVIAEIRTYPVKIKGKVLVLGIARDITERKHEREKLEESYKKLHKAISGNIQLMAATVEIRDPYTAGHQKRVADLARAIASEMALPEDQVEGIYKAGVIHDLGKISVPSEILSKPGKLSEMEFSLIKTHPQVGFDILREIEFPWPIAQIIYQHHERIDGSGYPQGLTGKKILLEARIMCVADVVEAMASHRPYRPTLGIDVALEEIKKNSGILYDAEVVNVCVKLFAEKKFKFKE